MNGNHHLDNKGDEEKQTDLLPHKYRPESAKKYICHSEQASHLKEWIQDFIDRSRGTIEEQSNSDCDDSSCSSEASAAVKVLKKCVLLTGPPGVGKTSLVYTIAKELKLHVIESHSSEKRDFKLFSMLKLTNQKGKINPIARLFQATQINQKQTTRRKRRKLTEPNQSEQPRVLSLSGTISIILFDDIDVVFEEDGPFLKSLVDFIKESKRPVILTATQSIDSIKEQIREVLIYCEHIDLAKPSVEDCAKLLRDVCKSEGYHKLSKIAWCRALANLYDCDIRQCLNILHLYGSRADSGIDFNKCYDCIRPDLSILNLKDEFISSNKTILQCYTNASLVDLMATRYNSFTRSTLLENWLDSKPTYCSETYDHDKELGIQIKRSIIDLNTKLHSRQMLTKDNLLINRNHFLAVKNELIATASKINSKIKCRIEPPEKEFYSDIVPMFGTLAQLDSDKRLAGSTNGGSSRRSRRTLSYLDDIKVYYEPDEIEQIGDFATMRSAREAVVVRENARVPEQK